MGRRRELQEMDRFSQSRQRRGTITPRGHRLLDDHARRQVSEYTALGRRKISRGNAPRWSSLTGWAWLVIGAGACIVLVVVTVIVLGR
jgi:hypothetical protein